MTQRRRRWWVGAALSAVAAIGAACVPAPATTPSFTAVAGTSTYQPFAADAPTSPVPAASVGFNVYGVTMGVPDKKSVVIGAFNEILRYDRGAKTVVRIAGSGATVAGPSVAVDDALGGPATDALLRWIPDIAATGDGTVWFTCDLCGPRILTVSPAGVLGVGAGGGSDTGDGGPATDAALGTPDQIVAAPDGDVYFLDDAFVRRVDLPTGTIHSVYEHTFPISQGGGGNRFDPVLHVDAAGRVYLFTPNPKELLRVDSGTVEPVALSGAGCIGQDTVLSMSGQGPGGSLAFVTGTWVEATSTWTEPRECRVVPSTGVTKQVGVDPTLAAALASATPTFNQISRHVVIGPDNVRWATGWGAGGAPQLFRWVTG